MSRRRPTRNRMRKLYEVAVVALLHRRCFFCKEMLLVQRTQRRKLIPGRDAYKRLLGGVQKKSVFAVTVHHVNENRADDRTANLAWCHRSCHKRHHMMEGHKEKRFRRKQKKGGGA